MDCVIIITSTYNLDFKVVCQFLYCLRSTPLYTGTCVYVVDFFLVPPKVEMYVVLILDIFFKQY